MRSVSIGMKARQCSFLIITFYAERQLNNGTIHNESKKLLEIVYPNPKWPWYCILSGKCVNKYCKYVKIKAKSLMLLHIFWIKGK